MGLPSSMPMNGVMRLKPQCSSTFAGAPMLVPDGNVGAGTAARVQLMFDASVFTRRAYSDWTARLYGSVQAVGFIAA